MSDKKTDDFLMRTITIQSEHYEGVRTRTSKGFSSISIRHRDGSSDSRIFEFNTDQMSAEYEERADELGTLLHSIAAEPCLLPSQEPPQ